MDIQYTGGEARVINPDKPGRAHLAVLPYPEPMLSSYLRSCAWLVAMLAAGWGAYESRTEPLVSLALVALSFGLAVAAWLRTSKVKEDRLHDTSVSTLVFPPESKFR